MGFKDADSKKRLGRRVEQAVTDAGYGSPDEFARGIGLPRSTFFKLRKGTLDPRFSTLMKIARGLGVSLSTLVGDSPEASLAGTSGSVRPLGDAAEPPVRLVNRKAQVKVNFSITSDNAPAWLTQILAEAKTATAVRSSKKRKNPSRSKAG